MNYYNPYFTVMPYTPTLGSMASTTGSKGLLSSLFSGGKISSFINGTQKTLSVINQAIPLVKQVSPVVKNAKTMFKVMNEFKKVDTSTTSPNNTINPEIINNSDIVAPQNQTGKPHESSNNMPTFFL